MCTCGMVRVVWHIASGNIPSQSTELGERTPVSTRMTEFIPERWLMCSTARRFNATVGDTNNATSALDITRIVARPDGVSVPGEWCVIFVTVLYLYTDQWNSFLGELTDVGRAVCPFAQSQISARLERDVVSDFPA